MNTIEKTKPHRRLFYFNLNDWTWWVWGLTASLLLAGIAGQRLAYLLAIAVTVAQLGIIVARERKLGAFPVQLRSAYLLLLCVCHLPGMNWLYWWPMLGTFALVIFGYCLLARILSLLPWNSDEPYTAERLRRIFVSPPDPSRVSSSSTKQGCAGVLCTVEAQIAPKSAPPISFAKSQENSPEIS